MISGAFGLFRREPMISAGGYEHETVGEDMEVVVRMRRRGVESGGDSRVVFVPDPVAWTESRGDCARSPASATAGTAAWPTSCAATRACSPIRATAPWGSSSCRTSG